VYDKYEYLLTERPSPGVLLITMNRRPERLNAADERMHRELVDIWRDVAADPETSVAVITGAGRGFSAGGDLEMEARLIKNYDALLNVMGETRDIVVNLTECDKPVISAINGPAAGAGLAIALMADISIIAEGVRFTDGHIRLGVAAGDHAAMLWPMMCGLAKAKYYLLTSDFIEAAEAERIGLVSKCVPADRLMSEALEVAAKLAAGPQSATRFTKRSLNHWIRSAAPIFESSLALEILNFFGPDIVEGHAALVEKRQAEFPSGARAATERGAAG
jgi:enoyl-CoA hydratase